MVVFQASVVYICTHRDDILLLVSFIKYFSGLIYVIFKTIHTQTVTQTPTKRSLYSLCYKHVKVRQMPHQPEPGACYV